MSVWKITSHLVKANSGHGVCGDIVAGVCVAGASSAGEADGFGVERRGGIP